MNLLQTAFMVLILPWSVRAQVQIANPGLPAHEVLEYVETIGKVSHPYSVTVTLKDDAPPAYYEFRTIANELESTYRLDPVTLISLSSETLTKAPDATVQRSSSYSNIKLPSRPDELAVTDMGSLPLVLRGYPWGKLKTAKIVYVGNLSYGTAAVTFEFRVIDQDTVTAAGKSWKCWHAQTGLQGD